MPDFGGLWRYFEEMDRLEQWPGLNKDWKSRQLERRDTGERETDDTRGFVRKWLLTGKGEDSSTVHTSDSRKPPSQGGQDTPIPGTTGGLDTAIPLGEIGGANSTGLGDNGEQVVSSKLPSSGSGNGQFLRKLLGGLPRKT